MEEMTFENIGSQIPTPDLSPVIDSTRNAIKGKSFSEAVLTLVQLFNSPDFEKTAKEIQSPKESSVWRDIVRQNRVDEHGKTKASKEPILADTFDESAQFEYAYCHDHARLHWGLVTAAILAPALHQINQEHAIRPEDIAFITDSNCFVAPDRVELISRGLYYGFLGDLQLALHLLIPQFENSLRLVLHQRGEVASTMDSEGIQDERNINTLLPKHPALEKIFGKSLLWDFWALLVAEWGGNIRNHIAHGMTPDGGFYGAESIYAWSLLLRFYCLPLLAQGKPEEPSHGGNT